MMAANDKRLQDTDEWTWGEKALAYTGASLAAGLAAIPITNALGRRLFMDAVKNQKPAKRARRTPSIRDAVRDQGD